jgi:hypothetical protein
MRQCVKHSPHFPEHKGHPTLVIESNHRNRKWIRCIEMPSVSGQTQASVMESYSLLTVSQFYKNQEAIQGNHGNRCHLTHLVGIIFINSGSKQSQ